MCKCDALIAAEAEISRLKALLPSEEPEPGTYRHLVTIDGRHMEEVYRAKTGWALTSRSSRRRAVGDCSDDPRVVALSALEKIPNAAMNEWQTAISMTRKVRGLSSLDKITVRRGRGRRKTDEL